MAILRTVNEIKWILFIGWRKTKGWFLRVKRQISQPSLPINPNGKVLLHLGCGSINAPGFINVDMKPEPHVHFLHDVTDLSFLPSNYADLVYACHVLEHVPAPKVRDVLWEWSRVLKTGGILRLSVPDFDRLIEVYSSCGRDVDSISMQLMGHNDGYLNHQSIFNFEYMKRILEEANLHDVRSWNPEAAYYHDFEDWASRPIVFRGQSFLISLNVEAIK